MPKKIVKEVKRKNKLKRRKKSNLLAFLLVAILVPVGILADIFLEDTVVGEMIGDTIGRFFNLASFFEEHHVTLLETLTIIVFIWVLSKILNILFILFFKHTKRSETIGIIINGMLKYVLVIIAIFLILGAWGVEAPTLLAGAGILGLAISFGAQSVIEDLLSGIFIISEKQFSIGDVIEIDGFRGTVIEMSIRTTKFESITGDTKIMNNSDIRGAINLSSNLSPSICDIAIGYDQDIKKVEKIIQNNLHHIRESIPAIIEGPFYFGVQELANSAVILRVVGRTYESHKLQTTRDLNREMKLLFDKHNITIPFTQIVVHNEKTVAKPKTVKKPVATKKKA